MLSTSDIELKKRLENARNNKRELTQTEKQQARKLIREGYSKKAVRLVFCCSYNDLK